MGLFDGLFRKKNVEEEVTREPGAWRQARYDVKNDDTYRKGAVTEATQQALEDIKEVGRQLRLKAGQELRADGAFLKGVANSLIGRVVGLGGKVRAGVTNISENIQRNNLIKKINGHLEKINQAKAAIKAAQTNVGNMLSEAISMQGAIPEDAEQEVKDAAQKLVEDVQKEKAAIDTIVCKFADQDKKVNYWTTIVEEAENEDEEDKVYGLDDFTLEELKDSEKNIGDILTSYTTDVTSAKTHEKAASSLISKYKFANKKQEIQTKWESRKLSFKEGATQRVTKAWGLFKKGVKFLGAGIAAVPGLVTGVAVAGYNATANYLRTDPLNLGPKIQVASDAVAKFGVVIQAKGRAIFKSGRLISRAKKAISMYQILSPQYKKLLEEYAEYYDVEAFGYPNGCVVDLTDMSSISINLNSDDLGEKALSDAVDLIAKKNDELFLANRELSDHIAAAKKATSGRGR